MARLGVFILNNWLLFLALIVILALLFVNLSKSRLLGFRDIKPDEAVRMINHDDALLIDARTNEEFAKGHILNAINLPFATLEDHIKELQQYRGRNIIVYCESGRQSAHAGATLRKNGFESIFKLSGGLLSWRGAGLPLVRT